MPFLTGLLLVAQVSVEPGDPPLPDGAVARLGTTHLRQAGIVMSLAFSPDGKLLASGAKDGSIRLWDPSDGREVRSMKGNTAEVLDLEFSPDGSRLLSCGGDGLLRLWSVDGSPILDFKGHRKEVTCAAFSPDGKRVASGSRDRTVRIWDPSDGAEVAQVQADRNGVSDLAFLRQGARLVFGGVDGIGIVWDLDQKKRVAAFKGHRDSILCLEVEPKGGRILTADHAGDAWLWDPETGEGVRRIGRGDIPVRSAAFAAGGARIILGREGALEWCDAESGARAFVRSAHRETIPALVASPDGKTVASGGDGGAIRLWRAADGSPALKLPGHSLAASALAVSRSADLLVSAGGDGALLLWDLKRRKVRGRFDHPGLRAMALSPEGTLLLSGAADRTVRLWDVPAGKQISEFKDHTYAVSALAFSSDGTRFVSGGLDGRVVLRGNVPAAEPRELGVHDHVVTCVRFSPDGTRVASGSRDRTIRIWNVATGKEETTFQLPPAAPYGIDFSRDGAVLAAGFVEPTIKHDRRSYHRLKMWEMLTGQALTLGGFFERRMGLEGDLALSPDGRFLAVHKVARLSLWDTVTEEWRDPASMDRVVTAFAFLPDGKSYVTAMEDTTILVWSTPSPKAPGSTKKFTPDALEEAWEALRGADASVAHVQARALILAGDPVVPFLSEKLKPVDESRVKALIADLDAVAPGKREAADRELKALGGLAGPLLRREAEAARSPERRFKLRAILKGIGEGGDAPKGERLARLRSLRLLRRIGTPAARRVLKRIAESEGGSPEVERARQMLKLLPGR